MDYTLNYYFKQWIMKEIHHLYGKSDYWACILISAYFRISLLNDGGLKILNVTKADAGTYTCTAENQFGKANGTTHLVVTGECFS